MLWHVQLIQLKSEVCMVVCKPMYNTTYTLKLLFYASVEYFQSLHKCRKGDSIVTHKLDCLSFP